MAAAALCSSDVMRADKSSCGGAGCEHNRGVKPVITVFYKARKNTTAHPTTRT